MHNSKDAKMPLFQKGVFPRILVLIVLSGSISMIAGILWEEESFRLANSFLVLISLVLFINFLVREIKISRGSIVIARKSKIQGFTIIMGIITGIMAWFSPLKQNDIVLRILMVIMLVSLSLLQREGYFIYPGVKIKQFGTAKNAGVNKIRFSDITEIIKRGSRIIIRTGTKQMWVDLSKIRKVDLDAFLEVFPQLGAGEKSVFGDKLG